MRNIDEGRRSGRDRRAKTAESEGNTTLDDSCSNDETIDKEAEVGDRSKPKKTSDK